MPFYLIALNLVYKPIFNIIAVLLAIFGGNLGIAIILLTIIVRLLLLKPTMQANNAQKGMVDIQPRMKEIQERYKDNPQQLADETMKLFKGSGNPLKGCLMMFVQMPVFIGLFYVVQNISKTGEDVNNKEDIYSFIYNYVHTGIDNINSIFLGMDLFSKADFSSLSIHALILALLAGILMYIQIKLTTLNRPSTPSMPAGMGNMPGMPQLPDMNKMMGYMNIFMVVMMSSFVYIMPSGVGLYIVTSTLFTITQYTIQYRQLIKVKFNAWKNK